MKTHHGAIVFLLSFAVLSVHTGICQQKAAASRLGSGKSVLINGVLVQGADRGLS
jgi:hypothetical protein